MARAWMVRAGASGEREAASLRDGITIVGWPEVGDLSKCATWEDLRGILTRTYPRENPRVVANWRGQLWRFIAVMEPGDLIVLPRKDRTLAIGRIAGSYEYRPDALPDLRHVRKVDWLVMDLPRDAAHADLRASLGSLLTVSELRRFDAASRIAHLASEHVDPGSSEASPDARAVTVPEQLAAMLEDRDEPLTLTVRELLALWGFVSRSGRAVETIRHALAEMGLSTMPPFTEVGFDAPVRIVAIGEAPELDPEDKREETGTLDLETVEPDDLGPQSVELPPEPNADTEAAETDGAGVTDEAPTVRMMLTVGRIPSARRAVETVRTIDPLTHAVDVMLSNGFDQLPVIDDNEHVIGMITWREIGTTSREPAALVGDACTHKVWSVRTTDPLVDCLDTVAEHGSVVVFTPAGALSGIVTRFDLTHRFEAEFRPYALLEEVERRLRRSVASALGKVGLAQDELKIRKIINGKANFVEYVDALERSDVWAATGWMFSQDIFIAKLTTVRMFRNRTMHFHDTDDDRDTALAAIAEVLTKLKVADPQP